MKKIFIAALLIVLALPVIGQNQDEYKFSLVPRRVSVPSVTGFITDDGLTPLTADWNVGAFDFTAKNLTATPTLSAEQLTNVAGWTAAGNWTYAGGKWSHATGSATALTATGETEIVVGTKYEITMTITTSTAGVGLAVSLGGQRFAVVSTGAPTTYTYNVTARSTAALAIIPNSGTWVGSVDSISVKILTAETGIVNAEGINLNSGQFLMENGNETHPVLAPTKSSLCGFYWNENQYFAYTYNGAPQWMMGCYGIYLGVRSLFFGSSYNAGDLILGRYSAATLQIGVGAASPIDQTIKGPDGSGTDRPGGMLTVQGGASTGTGAPADWRVQTSTISGTGSTANTYYDRLRTVGKVYSLANNTATDVFSVAVADGNMAGGRIDYTIEVRDGTDVQCESGTVTFAGVNKAVETWTTDIDEVSSAALSSGTLATTWAINTATADTMKITVNSNSSLTPTSTYLRYTITFNSPQVITIL